MSFAGPWLVIAVDVCITILLLLLKIETLGAGLGRTPHAFPHMGRKRRCTLCNSKIGGSTSLDDIFL